MQTEATTFILVSFEGPDRYSLAGGLGVRVAELSRALADAGHQTHVLFVGDPFRPAVEVTGGGRLVLHRWCQWLSKHYPAASTRARRRSSATSTSRSRASSSTSSRGRRSPPGTASS